MSGLDTDGLPNLPGRVIALDLALVRAFIHVHDTGSISATATESPANTLSAPGSGSEAQKPEPGAESGTRRGSGQPRAQRSLSA
jgi:hypothetical protein